MVCSAAPRAKILGSLQHFRKQAWLAQEVNKSLGPHALGKSHHMFLTALIPAFPLPEPQPLCRFQWHSWCQCNSLYKRVPCCYWMVGAMHSGKLCLHLSELGTGPGNQTKTKKNHSCFIQVDSLLTFPVSNLGHEGVLPFYKSPINTEIHSHCKRFKDTEVYEVETIMSL